MLAHADKFLGVSFTNKVSNVLNITQEEAIQFIEQVSHEFYKSIIILIR
jgi:hypothetical protein